MQRNYCDEQMRNRCRAGGGELGARQCGSAAVGLCTSWYFMQATNVAAFSCLPSWKRIPESSVPVALVGSFAPCGNRRPTWLPEWLPRIPDAFELSL